MLEKSGPRVLFLMILIGKPSLKLRIKKNIQRPLFDDYSAINNMNLLSIAS